MKKYFLILCFISTFSFSAPAKERKAIVIKPVADLLGQPYVQSPKKGISVDEYYHKIPFSGSGSACWRLHQVLFNEVVTVLAEKGNEVKVRISNFYYILDNESSPKDTYWTSKDNLFFLDNLKHKKIDLSHFPHPISYGDKKTRLDEEQNIVTLKKPFFDPLTKKTYSVGTRFLAHPGQNLKGSFDRGSFDIFIFDPVKQELVSSKIPKLNCIRNYFKKPEDQIQNFVQVLRSWTNHKNGFIPYVLGGFSWTQNCEQDTYKEKKDPVSNKAYFQREEWSENSKIGFDCVGIIGRAAQICNIPFFYKNTRTLLRGLETLKKGEQVGEGDLIWYPGHVMVISNLKNNLIIEARGYDNGNGKVREAPIQEVFGGVNSLSELVRIYQAKAPVPILDINGKTVTNCKSFKILKIHSVWNNF